MERSHVPVVSPIQEEMRAVLNSRAIAGTLMNHSENCVNLIIIMLFISFAYGLNEIINNLYKFENIRFILALD